jgi:aspartate aminotransferase
MIDKDELEKIADVVKKNNLLVITDEIYEKIIYTQKHTSFASIDPEVKKRTITINGVSKAYAMTGWRIGYAGGPKEIIQAMKALQSQITSNASSISQMAALEAISGDQRKVEDMRKAFAKRRQYGIDKLTAIKDLSVTSPEGAFYFFVSVEKLLNKQYPTSTAWCEGLLEKEQVAVVPGEAFEYPGYFRLSFAASMEDLQEAIRKIKRFIKIK